MSQTKHFRSTVSLGEFIAKEGSLPSQVLVLPMGKWNTLPYGIIEVNESQVDQMIANFETGVRKDVPIDVDHDGGKAAGWVKKLKKTSEGMIADIDWTPYGKELLENGEYKLFSPEWSFEYLDPLTSAAHGATFIAGTLTNRPLFKQLPKLVANEQSALTQNSEIVLVLAGEKNMNLEELIKKTIAELTLEEKAFIIEHQAELTEEQKTQLQEVLQPAEEVKNEETEEVENTETEQEAENVSETTTDNADSEADVSDDSASGTPDATEIVSEVVTANEQSVTITASELAHYKALEADMAKKAMEDKVQKFVASEKGGSILPKSKEAWVNFLMKCSEAQQTEALDLLAKLPQHKIATVKADETAETQSNVSLADTIDLKAKELIAKEPTLGLAQAYKRVLSDPTLAKAYENSVE